MAFMVLLLIILGVVYRATTPEERARLFQTVLVAIRQVKDAASRSRPEREKFREVLRARTPRALVTPALAALNVVVFAFMLFGAGTLSSTQTLVDWGANLGPRTTNGEWWRLGTAIFVHSRMLHLLINVACLVQIGLILERLVGPLFLATVYVAAGVFASLVSVSTYPMAASVGASGAIFGLYGLLLVSSIWGMLCRSSVTIPLTVLKRLGLAAAGFILYNVANDGVRTTAEVAGGVAGLIFGVVVARDLSRHKPPVRRVAVAMSAAVVIAVAAAVPLGGITDARPEIERVVAVEDRTASAYEIAVKRFRNGRITAEALAQLIDRMIIPELQAADARLKTLDKVPQEQQRLVAGAEEYLRLRSDSWRFRAEGLRKAGILKPREDGRTERESDASWRRRVEAQHRANSVTLGKAEGAERASLEALQGIRP